MKGRMIEAPVTTRAAATMIALLAWLMSISAPAGACTLHDLAQLRIEDGLVLAGIGPALVGDLAP